MKFLHYQLNIGPGKRVRVTLNERANVRLLDTLTYYHYAAGRPYQATGEYPNVLQADLRVPHRSQWHIVIDHGQFKGELKASVRLLAADGTETE